MLPNPLHPALVHFPIVLILIGAVLAVAAVFIRRWHLPVVAASLLTLGALGALVAVQTGEGEAGMVGDIAASTETILDEHQDWAETTRSLAIVAAVLALVSVGLIRFPRAARIVGGVTALAALAAAYSVAQTGHYGGQLVYKNGVGVNLDAGPTEE